MSDPRQCWRTPDDFFDMLDREVGGFDIDVAADRENTKCSMHICESENSFDMSWFLINDNDNENKAWCNPPYGRVNGYDLRDWVKRAVQQVNAYPGAVVYMLLNHDASTKWYDEACNHASEIRIMTKKRIPFEAPDGVKPSSNSKAQCVIVFRKKQPSAPCHVFHWDWKADMEAHDDTA